MNSSEMLESYKSANPIIIEKGNSPNSTIPEIPEVSLNRHEKQLQHEKFKNSTLLVYFLERYKVTINRLLQNYISNDFNILSEIKKAAQLYGIKPEHILGAIIGEHVFNVDLKDRAQEYSLRAAMWVNFFSGKHPFADVIDCPEMKTCENQATDYMKWECYDSVWTYKLRGKTACNNKSFVNKSLMMSFFDPTVAGKTYGLGQLGPIKMLSLTDIVNRFSHLPKLTIRDQNQVYESILDPKTTIHYIAAAVYNSIQIYKKEANIDISNNIGLTATLYNLGYERRRAIELDKINEKNVIQGKELKLPQVNYYGWFVNYVEKDLENKLHSSVLK